MEVKQLLLAISLVMSLVLMRSAIAFTISPQAVAHFNIGGCVEAQQASAQQALRRGGVASLNMKKGKPNVPIQNRGGYMNQQRMEEQQQQAMGNENPDLPKFDLFCRSSRNPMWYPCGTLQGDDRSKASVQAWMGGLLSDFYRGQIERGVATSVLEQKKQLVQNIVRAYPALGKNKMDIQFGFRVRFPGLEEKVGPLDVTPIVEEMKMGPFDKFKKSLGF